eukprot:5649881-Pleurochrysis_carterae.AAC.2
MQPFMVSTSAFSWCCGPGGTPPGPVKIRDTPWYSVSSATRLISARNVSAKMDLSGATRERASYVQRSAGSRENKRGRRVPATVGVGLSARIRFSISAARSSMVPSSGDLPRRSRFSCSNCASRKA